MPCTVQLPFQTFLIQRCRKILAAYNNKVNIIFSHFVDQAQTVGRHSTITKEGEGDLAEKKKALMRGKTHSGGLRTIL